MDFYTSYTIFELLFIWFGTLTIFMFSFYLIYAIFFKN